jgi:hypothetical protein
MVPSSVKGRDLAQIEELLADDQVLVAVAELFAEPATAPSRQVPATRPTKRRPMRWGLGLILTAVLIVIAGGTWAAGVEALSPLVAAAVIVAAAGIGAGFLAATVNRDRNPATPAEGLYVNR